MSYTICLELRSHWHTTEQPYVWNLSLTGTQPNKANGEKTQRHNKENDDTIKHTIKHKSQQIPKLSPPLASRHQKGKERHYGSR